MKKLLTLSALATCGVLFSPSASATCAGNDNACIQRMNTIGALHNDPSLCAYGYNPNCYPNQQSGSRSRSADMPPPPPTSVRECQATPQGTQMCAEVSIKVPNYTFNVMETNTQGNIVYARFYHVDGRTVKSEQWYNAQGYKHGAFKSYHQNGRTKSLGNYVNNQLQGDFKIHDENGQLIKIEHYKDDWSVLETHYQNGKKHGQEAEFTYVNTRKGLTPVVIRTTQWANGKKHGEEKFFEADKKARPKLIRTVVWQNGNQVR